MVTPVMIFTCFTVLLNVLIPNNGKEVKEGSVGPCNSTSSEHSGCLFKNITNSANSSLSTKDHTNTPSILYNSAEEEESKDTPIVSHSQGGESSRRIVPKVKARTLESDVKVALIGTLLDIRGFYPLKEFSPLSSDFPYGESFYLDDTSLTSQYFSNKDFQAPSVLNTGRNFKHRLSQETSRFSSHAPSNVFEIKTFGSDGIFLPSQEESFSMSYNMPPFYKFSDSITKVFDKFNAFERSSKDTFFFPQLSSSPYIQPPPFPFRQHRTLQASDSINTGIRRLPITRHRGMMTELHTGANKYGNNKKTADMPYVACRFELKGNMPPSSIPIDWCDYLLVTGFIIERNSLVAPSRGVVNEFSELKNRSNVKLFASVKDTFSNIAPFSSHRQRFVDSTVRFFKESNFDGLDVDWEWTLGGPEKEEMASLLSDLKIKFNRREKPYLLSATVASTLEAYSKSYDAKTLKRLVEFVNLKTYDLYYHSRRARLAHPCPLFPWSIDDDEVKTKNLEYCADFWYYVGMPKSKIMVTIPTYGRTYQLKDEKYVELNSPATGIGFHGGIATYNQVCEFLKGGASHSFDYWSKVPYAFNRTDWVGYENIESVISKATWITNNGYRGITVQNLNSDDWRGQCDGQKFPLLGAIYRTIKIPK